MFALLLNFWVFSTNIRGYLVINIHFTFDFKIKMQENNVTFQVSFCYLLFSYNFIFHSSMELCLLQLFSFLKRSPFFFKITNVTVATTSNTKNKIKTNDT